MRRAETTSPSRRATRLSRLEAQFLLSESAVSTTFPPLIEGLRQARAYPHTIGRVTVLETHISWVLLAGEFAYKIKKPVRLDFLDFSSLERRRFYCEEELRLNRRLAPEIYLDVVAIGGLPSAPVVGADGEPLEFAVRMRQFPQDALLSRMIAEGRLEAGHVDQLALEVAGFHTAIDRAPPDGVFGRPDVILREAIDNLDALRPVVIGPARRSLEQLRDWTQARCAQRAAAFLDRLQQGFIRECHGDLHLRNMVWWLGRVVLFDGIEFNPEFRWIDVLSDTAFAAMDLADRGRRDFAHRFLNAYLERTGDFAGLAVLPFYLAYRALVRAKVAGIRLTQVACDAGEHERLMEELQKYVELACGYTQERVPTVSITHGVTGSGKTAGTRSLIEAEGAIRIRSDVERKRLFGLKAEDRPQAGVGTGIYAADASRRTYERLAALTSVVVRAGYPVIVDATFLQRQERLHFRRLAEQLGAPFRILPFTADEATLRSRVRERSRDGRDASDADEAVLARQLQTLEPLGEDERRLVSPAIARTSHTGQPPPSC
jgi:aminoglycoside phosphotransferase family enzyme/predicted kinase